MGVKTYTIEEIRDILEKHRKWRDEVGGGSRANLMGAKYGEDSLRGVIQIGPIGSRKSYLVVFGIGEGGFVFRTGCFSGDLEKFEAIINKTHGNSKHGDDYRAGKSLAKAMLPATERPAYVDLLNPMEPVT